MCAVAIIGLAAAVRIALIAFGWPELNSDEGTMGLMALHIAHRGELPVFVYGQSYMGALEAYLGAALFHVFNPSAFALRLGLVLLFTLFLVSLYLLASRLFGKCVALVSVALLSLGSEQMLFQQLEAVGRVETWLFGTLALLLAFQLALSATREPTSHSRGRRLLLYAAWGLVAGLALWSDMVALPFLLMAALLLAVFCRRELRSLAAPCLLLGLLVGVAPVIAYNINASPNHSALAILVQTYRAGGTGQNGLAPSPARGLAGATLVTLPVITGANPLCPVSAQTAWPLSGQSSAGTIRCTVVHGIWGAGAMALGAISAFLATVAIWRRRKRRRGAVRSLRQREETVRRAAQLALVGSGALILVLYILSPASAHVPWYSRRYLTPLWIVIPAVIAPLVSAPVLSGRTRRRVWNVCRYAALAVLAAGLVLGTVRTFRQTPDMQWWNNRQYAFVSDLLRIHASRIYSDYWTCDRVIFQSRERVICSVLGDHLQPGQDRYLAYRTIVGRDPHPSYAFLPGSPQLIAFDRRIARSRQSFRRYSFDGYVVYQPST